MKILHLKKTWKKKKASVPSKFILRLQSHLESSIGIDKVAEQSIDFITKRVRSPEVLVEEEAVKNEEDDELIFRKMNIPWMSDKNSTL